MLIRRPGHALALSCDCCEAHSPEARSLLVIRQLAGRAGWDPDPSSDGSGCDRCPACVSAERWPATAGLVRLALAGGVTCSS